MFSWLGYHILSFPLGKTFPASFFFQDSLLKTLFKMAWHGKQALSMYLFKLPSWWRGRRKQAFVTFCWYIPSQGIETADMFPDLSLNIQFRDLMFKYSSVSKTVHNVLWRKRFIVCVWWQGCFASSHTLTLWSILISSHVAGGSTDHWSIYWMVK